jgi:hypothetical protein
VGKAVPRLHLEIDRWHVEMGDTEEGFMCKELTQDPLSYPPDDLTWIEIRLFPRAVKNRLSGRNQAVIPFVKDQRC